MAFRFKFYCQYDSTSWKLESSKCVTRTDKKVQLGFTCDPQVLLFLVGCVTELLRLLGIN